MNYNNVLVTGGKGLVGSEFLNYNKTNSSEFNLMYQNDIIDMLNKYKPESIIHTAGYVGGLGANMNNLAEFYYRNTLINTNLIHESYKFGIKKMICFLSTCIFPDKIDYPLTEEKIHLGPPHDSNFAYAYAKRMVDVQIESYNKSYNTKYFSVIPTNIYGPNDNYNLNNGHVVPTLIHKVYNAIKTNSDVTVWGSGKPLREFIYSKDVAKICENLIENYNDTNPIILSNSIEVSIEELVTTICDIMKFKNKIIWDKTKPDGQYKKTTDNSNLKKIIPDLTFTKLYDGLEETIHFFQNNYHNLRK
jgi:GDP-L-fucose synthase